MLKIKSEISLQVSLPRMLCSMCLRLLLFFALSIKRSNCYMVWGGEFSGSQQTRITQEDFVIGCLVDLDTGLMTFMANGKEVNTFYQVSKH